MHAFIHTWIIALCTLSKIGRHDLAMKVALQKDLPGWGYSVTKGATTLWENWNGADSHSHPMFGAVIASMVKFNIG